MRNKPTLLLFLLLLVVIPGRAQSRDTVTVRFPANENNVKKSGDSNDSLHFYMGDQHFIFHPHKDDVALLALEEILNSSLLQIEEFLRIAEKVQRESIEKDPPGTVEVLFKDDIFSRIYLVEQLNDSMVKRYEVHWIEEVE